MSIDLRLKEIMELARSRDRNDRLAALKQIEELEPLEPRLFDTAKELVGDRADNTVRWQACIVVGHYIETMPERVWGVIAEYGDSADEDMRAAISTCLLEHLLDQHFDEYFPKCRKLVKTTRYFADTLGAATVMSRDKRERVGRFLESRVRNRR
jgi:hypothetical protein